jgi:hypothetical protein
MSDQPVAILVSTRNAEAVTGQSWRWVREFSVNNGVEVHRAGRKPFVFAEDLLDAIKRSAEAERDENAASSIAEENILRQLGKRRRRRG